MPEHESHAPSEPAEPSVSSVSPDGLVPEVIPVEAPATALPERNHAFIETAEALQVVEEPSAYFDAANIIASTVENNRVRAGTQARIAVAQVQAGDTDSAHDTFAIAMLSASAIEYPADRMPAQLYVAKKQVKVGDVEGARKTITAASETASKVTEGNSRTTGLADIGVVQFQVGNTDEARQAFATATQHAAQIASSYYREIDQEYISSAQIEVGFLAGAARTSAEISDPGSRASMQAVIAEAQIKSGDIAGAQETLIDVKQSVADSENSPHRSKSQADLAVAMAGVGDIASALQLAAAIEAPILQGRVLATIGTIQDKAGDAVGARDTFDLAIEMSAEISNSRSRTEMQSPIVGAKAESGDIDGALRAVAAMDDEENRAASQVYIATVQFRAGDVDGARKTLNAAAQSVTAMGFEFGRRGKIQVAIVAALDETGDLDGALKVTASINEDHEARSEAYVAVARVQSQNGDTEAARRSLTFATQSAASIEQNETLRGSAQVAVATAQAETGDFDGALQAVAAMDYQHHRIDTQVSIAMAQARAGDIIGAKQTARTLDPEFRADVYATIATTLAGSLPALEQLEAVKQAKAEDRQYNVGAFWPEIAADPHKSMVMAREIRSSDQALAMLANFEVGTKGLSSEARGEVMSLYLSDLALTHGIDSDMYKVDKEINKNTSIRRLERLIDLDSTSDQFRDAFDRDFPMADISSHPWLLDPELTTENDPYPLKRGIAEQNRYLADHSFTDLAAFNRSTLGKLIHSRLDNGAETNLHDATQWLSTFALSEGTIAGAYDARRLKDVGAEGSDINLENFREPLWDEAAATDLLASMINLPEDQRHRLPGNTSPQDIGRYEDMLWQPAHTLVYRALLEHGINHPTAEQLRAYADDLIEDYWETQPELMVTRKDQPVTPGSREALSRQVHELIARSYLSSVQSELESPSKYIGELKSQAKNRKAYIDDATTWLNRHADTPHQVLTKAWQDRPLALSDGCPDKATAIVAWASANAMRAEVSHMADADGIIHHPEGNFDTWRLTGELQAFTAELSRCYGAELTLNALMKLDRQSTPEADLPPANLELSDDYRFEILSKDDPRGFSIGHDTGCCMVLDDAAESCVWAGYSDRRYGFAALYGPDGRLQAQSLVYHNPDESSDVLVLDNIESNEGRDLRKVRERYIEALTKYLASDGPAAGKWKRVQVGEGYSDVSLSDLPKAEAITTPKRGTYSDSHKQRLLLELK